MKVLVQVMWHSVDANGVQFYMNKSA